MADVKVDTEGLRSAGSGLVNTAGNGGGAPQADPAAIDPVSTSVAETLSHWSQVLWTLMEHAGQQREAGGVSLAGTATYLGALDDAGAAGILSVVGDGQSSVAMPGSLPPAVPAAVPLPTLPGLPQLPAPPPLSGEQVAALVHAQPQPDRLRAFASQWRDQVAPQILAAADHTRDYGNSVAQAWDSGASPASDNLLQHADWLESSLHAHALKLADSADQAAGHAETVIQNTPAPQEFRDIRNHLRAALAHYQASGDPTAAIALANQLGQKQATAVSSFQTYAAAAPGTTSGAANPPAPAPSIVRGTGPNDTIDKHADQLNPEGRHGDIGHGDDQGTGTGNDTSKPSTADTGPPLGQSGLPPTGPAQPLPATQPAAATPAANMAGTVLGAGLGTVGQLANSLHDMSSAGSPLQALSGLSSLPGMGGMPNTGQPQMPSGGDGAGDPMPDAGNDHDFGSGGTIPAGGGDGGSGAPVGGSAPVLSGTAIAANPAVGTPIGGSAAGTPAAVGGGSGMVAPPMMGGLGRGNEEERKPQDWRRVIMRPVVNSEPVFGEVERKHTTPRRRKEER